MADEIKRTREIVELLRQTTSLTVIGAFLKSKDLSYSASGWEEMLDKRIIPAVRNKQISNDELVALLRSAEECGGQHIFLHSARPAARAIELMDRARVTAILRTHRLEGLLTTPLILDQPSAPALVDVRWESAKVDLSLIVKMVELRTSTRLLREERFPDGTLHKIYADERERVVHLCKLHRNGLFELRIASQANSNKYDAEVRRVWRYFEAFFPRADFADVSLSPAKNKLWIEREALSDIIRYTNTTVRNDFGNVIQAISGSGKSDLSSDKALGGGLDHALEHDDSARCEGSNLWFKKAGTLSTEVHVLLSGESNEFAIPANCSAEDYQYVLNQLIHFNK